MPHRSGRMRMWSPVAARRPRQSVHTPQHQAGRDPRRPFSDTNAQRPPPTDPQFAAQAGRDPRRRPFSDTNAQRPPPTDPQFAAQVRGFHKIIKLVHHLQNVSPQSGEVGPRMIARMVDILSSFVKPAIPTIYTTDMIVGNAKNWGHTTLIILQNHYKDGLETLLKDLPAQMTTAWRDAFVVASRWARRSLARVTQEVLDHAEALIMSCVEAGDTGDVGRQASDAVQGEPAERQVRHRGAVLPESQSRFLEEIVPVSSEAESASGQLEAPAPRGAVATAGDSHLLEGDELLDLDLTPTLIPDVQLHASTVHIAQVHREGRSLSDELLEDLDAPFSHDSVGDHTSTPRLSMYKPYRHMNTDHKLIDWTINITKKWIIMGDSNVARLPVHSIPDLQIDSYPGANFRHAEAILAKTPRQEWVEKVVLAFGLNSRAQKAKETAVKQMQAALRVAKNKFPFAEIWIPLVNFSSSLPPDEVDTLQKLNAHVSRNMPFIEPLGDGDFQTEEDQIHWTQATARAMFRHWCSFLNLDAP
ncbi:hypothetical protein Q5P01_000179 [Channa striata]|uniref:Uncharacterized protein n=1 Tax=Channa striata TaxID=64152 RepID=A0AA88IGM6_CHASR|nr:hypothetical protein Q5P01_000179 [Channa striata]